MIYKDCRRNHVVIPGRESALDAFLNQDYKGMKHKLKNAINSHSEDALTWSCFDVISSFTLSRKISALDEIFEDAYQGKCSLLFRECSFRDADIKIHIGK